MPVGIILDSLAVLIGGGLGALLGGKLPQNLRRHLPMACGMMALTIGIVSVGKLENLSAVALACILGYLTGELLDLDGRLARAVSKLGARLTGLGGTMAREDTAVEFLSVLVLFCASGTGVFGALNEGLTGDATILTTKAILDFFTAMIFAATLGYIVCLICLPQSAVQLVLFLFAAALMPLLSAPVMSDFKACGGLVTFGIGLNVLQVTRLKVTNFLPGLVLVVPLSIVWQLWL